MPLTPNNREEYWLQGMVDGQTTLEPNKRREYWYKEIVDAIGSGGGGGTGGGVFVVHIVENVADKTWQEIKNAYESQIVIIPNSTQVSYLTGIQEPMPPFVEKYQVSFAMVDDNGDGTGSVTVDTLKCDTANDYPSYL